MFGDGGEVDDGGFGAAVGFAGGVFVEEILERHGWPSLGENFGIKFKFFLGVIFGVRVVLYCVCESVTLCVTGCGAIAGASSSLSTKNINKS